MGREQFEKIVAQAPRLVRRQTVVSNTTSLASGGSETLSVYAPANAIGEIELLFFNAKPVTNGDGTGDHAAAFTFTSTSGQYWQIVGSDDANIRFDRMHAANGTIEPADEAAAAAGMRGARFDDSEGVSILYENNAVGSTTAERKLILNWTEREVRS